jgi:hypothetical protein
MGAQILYFQVFPTGQMGLDVLFELESSVIGSQS